MILTETTSESTAASIFDGIDRFIWSFASMFGDKAKEVERFIKFALVGGFGAVVDFTTLNVLQATILPPNGHFESLNIGLATGTAFTLAVISNFFFNRYWTFPDSRSRSISTQLTQFFLISVVGLLFRLVFVSLSYNALGHFGQHTLHTAADTTSINQLGSNIAQAISIGIVLFWNFFANRYWTYNDVDQGSA